MHPTEPALLNSTHKKHLGEAIQPNVSSGLLLDTSQAPACEINEWNMVSLPVPIDPLEETFRHSYWAPDRQRYFDSLLRCKCNANRVMRYASCGSDAIVECNHAAQEYRIRANYCHDRFCQPCAAARGRQIAAAIHGKISLPRVRFVTLTLCHSDKPLTEQVDRLRDGFATLRHKPLWKRAVSGGVAVMEIKLSKSDKWHPHLHCIIEGQFIDQKELSALWRQITGDSYIVDIRAVDQDDAMHDVSKYVCKYVCKPAGVDVVRNPDRLDEYVLAMKGQRVFNLLGTWRKYAKDADAEPVDEPTPGATPPVVWEKLGSLSQIMQANNRGDPRAAAILQALQARRARHESLQAGLGQLVAPPPV